MTVREGDARTYVRRHLRFGWWSLLVFLTLGIVLEAMHGFKVAWYINVGMETRRLMWRLAHAHGAFLGLVHVALAMSIHLTCVVSPTPPTTEAHPSQASRQARRRNKADRGQSKPGPKRITSWHHWASRSLMGASVALPGGFFLGGLVVRGGDPGLGILVLPVGALLLFLAVLSTARGVSATDLDD